jgi:transposase
MLTKKELKLLAEVLNLEGIKVSYKHHHEGIGIILKIESVAKDSAGKICGTNSDKLHLLGATHAEGTSA